MDEKFNTPDFSGGNNTNQPNKDVYYVPPVQQPAQQRAQAPTPVAPPKPQQVTYYTPPIKKENEVKAVPRVDDKVNPPKEKKKSNKSLTLLIIIIILCALVTVSGLIIASLTSDLENKQENSKPNSSQFEEFGMEDAEDINSDSDEASATIDDSNEASKTDEYGNLTAAGVVEKSIDSCVGITVYSKYDSFNSFYGYGYDDDSDSDEQMSGEGSGVIMSEADGKTYIMTCAHVIEDADSVKITLENGKEYDGKIVGTDSQTDIGVVVIEAKGLKIASFGDSNQIEVGETCVAIGCPAGLQFMNSVTQGIVSALDRPVSSSIGYKNTCIQVDAAINPGNSGGALFNMQGQVIGINSSKIASTEYEGMGFAVPSNTAVKTANSIIKYGYVAGRAKVGIEYSAISNFKNSSAILSALEKKGFKDANGVMVIRTIEQESGLYGKVEEFDMIVAVDGKVLTSSDVMTSYLNEHSPGDSCKLTIARIENNSIKTFDVNIKLIESK